MLLKDDWRSDTSAAEASSRHGNTSPRSMSGAVLSALAPARTARDTGLQRAMTLPDMWWAFGEQEYPRPVTAAASENLGRACSWCQCLEFRKGHDKCSALSISVSIKCLMCHKRICFCTGWNYDPLSCSDINKGWSAAYANSRRLRLDHVFFHPFVNSHHWLQHNFVMAAIFYQLKQNWKWMWKQTNLLHQL